MAVTAVERCCLAASGTRAPLSIRRPATDLASLTPAHTSQPRSRPDPVNRAPSRAMRQGLPQRRSGGMAAGWMALISLPRVWSPASGLGQAAGFDSPVGIPTLYPFAAAFDVRSRASNPRPISLTPCHPRPERLSARDLATSPAPPPCAHAQWLTHNTY